MARVVSNTKRVRRYLRKHHAPCPRCRFDLFGLEEPRCPECGTRIFIEDLIPIEPDLLRWRKFRLGFAIAAVLMAVTTAGLMRITDASDRPDAIPLGILAASYAVALSVYAFRGERMYHRLRQDPEALRRYMREWDSSTRWVIGLTMLVPPIVWGLAELLRL